VSLPDQRAHWDAVRRQTAAPTTAHGPSSFAQAFARRLPATARVLELGCGPGHDSAHFATLGHIVVATDFSIEALRPARAIHGDGPGLSFCLLDLAAPLPFRDAAFDAIYARLSLHYFPDRVTRRIFRELRRVLPPGGVLGFMCKMTGDPLYGRGREIEPDMFELKGHLRHFFSPDYARTCLTRDGDFVLIELTERRDTLYDRDSAFIEVFAQAR
jgi:SAM-dependent methyltransferase